MRLYCLGVLSLMGGLGFCPESHAASLFKCRGPDGVPSYVREEIKGQSCVQISTSPATTSGRWEFVTISNDGSVISYDRSTIRRGKDTVTAWVQFFHAEKKAYIAGKGYSQKNLRREKFNCERMTVQTLSSADYDEAGASIDSRDYLLGTIDSPIVPDSIYEAVWQELCSSPTKNPA